MTEPTDDEREALAQWLHMRFAWSERTPWRDLPEHLKDGWRYLAGDAPAGFRRSVVPEPSAPPVYLAADLWQALGAPVSDFDAYYERNRWADTWANLLGTVRDRFRPKCGELTEGERRLLIAGHLPPHYGPSDVGRSEPVPVGQPQGEPSDASVLAALNEMHAPYYAAPLDLDSYTGNQVDRVRRILRAASAVSAEPMIECPHWSPGKITLRRGCTACAAVTEQGENRG